MPSEHRKRELISLLGNCVIAITLAPDGPILEKAQKAAEQHILELDKDYPGWQEELE